MTRHPRIPRPELALVHKLWVDGWRLALEADNNSTTATIRIYLYSVSIFSAWLQSTRPGASYEDVQRDDLRQFWIWMRAGGQPCPHQFDSDAEPGPAVDPALRCDGYSSSSISTYAKGVQRFFAWYAAEDQAANPHERLAAPSPPSAESLMPDMISDEDLVNMIKNAEAGREFADLRDAAILRFMGATGTRIAEVAGVDLEHLDLANRSARVFGKGRRWRTVFFDPKTALAIHRYLRSRSKLSWASGIQGLWLSRNHSKLSVEGLYAIVRRRGDQVGVKVHPHMIRHRWGDRAKAAGASRESLKALGGWRSDRSLERYGIRGREARAASEYDRLDIMRGV
ncbi:integrase/recombinase XerD [Catenuloplanes nepalensis]|uniref:Integrase/recombinase XerD n=1 Tax=Catenuloplanes nepalensis TaxID=587533 RepID=A0ABT9N6J4_9ACTN|nr:tyrosine-type recombinase/integrase [Catenuloplanes nepalensis]MDP9799322.1 integrase/recombinase XerD [Catenuloplanes nepalensis]